MNANGPTVRLTSDDPNMLDIDMRGTKLEVEAMKTWEDGSIRLVVTITGIEDYWTHDKTEPRRMYAGSRGDWDDA